MSVIMIYEVTVRAFTTFYGGGKEIARQKNKQKGGLSLSLDFFLLPNLYLSEEDVD